MQVQEREHTMTLSRATVNLMTSLMPTMEGLFLISVLDGKKGIVLFRYDASVEEEMQGLFKWLANNEATPAT